MHTVDFMHYMPLKKIASEETMTRSTLRLPYKLMDPFLASLGLDYILVF